MKKINVVLYEPEIPDNVGNIIRTCACYDVALYVIEPVGFTWKDRGLKKSQMDYRAHVTILHSWMEFKEILGPNRLILTTPHTKTSIFDFEFNDNDFILFGRESNGVEVEIAAQCTNMITIPMHGRTRSFNLATCVAMTLVVMDGQ